MIKISLFFFIFKYIPYKNTTIINKNKNQIGKKKIISGSFSIIYLIVLYKTLIQLNIQL